MARKMTSVVRTFQDTLAVRLPEALGVLPVPIAGHCAENGRAIINFPGWNGTMDGYENKYIKLGQHVASGDHASFVRTMIPAIKASADTARGVVKYPWRVVAQSVVRTAVNYVLDNAEGIAGTSRDQIHLHLIGTSAGGGAIAGVAHEFPQVKKLLFVAPAVRISLVGKEAVIGMRKFLGDAAFMIGDRDGLAKDGKTIESSLCLDTVIELGLASQKHGKRPRYWIVPGADHNFAGREFGRILSIAHVWAFACEGDQVPDRSLAIDLYGDPPTSDGVGK